VWAVHSGEPFKVIGIIMNDATRDNEWHASKFRYTVAHVGYRGAAVLGLAHCLAYTPFFHSRKRRSGRIGSAHRAFRLCRRELAMTFADTCRMWPRGYANPSQQRDVVRSPIAGRSPGPDEQVSNVSTSASTWLSTASHRIGYGGENNWHRGVFLLQSCELAVLRLMTRSSSLLIAEWDAKA